MVNRDLSVFCMSDEPFRGMIGRAALEISDMNAMITCDVANLSEKMVSAALTDGHYSTDDLSRLRMLEWIQNMMKLMRSLLDDVERCLSVWSPECQSFLLLRLTV